jgi:hypothetical protein
VADRQPAGLATAVARAAVGLRKDEGLGAAPSKEIAPLGPHLELPARPPEMAMASQGGDAGETLLPTRLDDAGTAIVGLTQDEELDAGRGVALPEQLGRPLRRLATGATHARALRFLALQPEAPGDYLVTVDQEGADVLVPPDVGRGGRAFHRRDGVHQLAPCGWLRGVQDQGDGLTRAGMSGAQ